MFVWVINAAIRQNRYLEGIDISKANASKECHICYYWYFKGTGFKYEPYLCNGCHALMQKAINFMFTFMLKEMLTEFNFGKWAKAML